jgi:hypothetical protein
MRLPREEREEEGEKEELMKEQDVMKREKVGLVR